VPLRTRASGTTAAVVAAASTPARGRSSAASAIDPRAAPARVSGEVANGTSFAASRSTLVGSGSDRPSAAQSGTGSAKARTHATRPARPRTVGPISSPNAAVITQREATPSACTVGAYFAPASSRRGISAAVLRTLPPRSGRLVRRTCWRATAETTPIPISRQRARASSRRCCRRGPQPTSAPTAAWPRSLERVSATV
jgi:hypothetical protein